MSDANVWQPRVILDISQEVKSVSQKFIATEGQTTFDITDFAYAVGTSSLAVYKEGSLIDAVELSDTSFVIIEGCAEGDKVIAKALVDTVLGDITDIEQHVIDSAASATSAQLKAWEAEAERLTADSYATEAASVPVKLYASNGDGTFTATDTDPTEYSSLHYSTTVDLINDTTPQLGGVLDTNGRLVQLSKGADIASAATLPNAVDGNYANVTGVAAITAITSTGKIGTVIKRHFDASLTLTHHATNLILPGGVDIITAAGDEAEFIEYATGDFICTSYTKADGTPVVRTGADSVQKFIVDGTWTKPDGITKVIIEQAAGGGGGAGGGSSESGSAGGGGGYGKKLLDVSAIASETVTVGDRGTGGAANTNGTSGTSSSFGAHLTCTGGANGVYSTGSDAGGVGGTSTGGDINIQGGQGQAAYTTADDGKAGGGNPLGNVGMAGRGTNGVDATGYGAGGAGGSGNGILGSDGAPGIVIVWEYK